MTSPHLLLLSNSKNYGQEYLEHARQPIREFLGDGVRSVAFVPYAAATFSEDEYASRVGAVFGQLGYELVSVHSSSAPRDAVRSADAVAVGGGNTFLLLKRLYETGLLDVIRERAAEGMPYIGWSAGSNVACPTIRTTNDMPIVEPPGLNALGLVDFQINPHYLDEHPERHQGETREQRLLEFVAMNPNKVVVGLREGSMLRIEGDTVRLLGNRTARVFGYSADPHELGPEDDLDFLQRLDAPR